MLDLDHEHALRADDDLVDFIRKPRCVAGMAEIGEQYPGTGYALQLALEFFDGERFPLID